MARKKKGAKEETVKKDKAVKEVKSVKKDEAIKEVKSAKEDKIEASTPAKGVTSEKPGESGGEGAEGAKPEKGGDSSSTKPVHLSRATRTVKGACDAFMKAKRAPKGLVPSAKELDNMIAHFVTLMQISKDNATEQSLQYLFDFFVENRDTILAPEVGLQGIRRLKPTTAQSLEVFYTVLMVAVERKLGIQSTPISMKAARHLLKDHPVLDFVARIIQK